MFYNIFNIKIRTSRWKFNFIEQGIDIFTTAVLVQINKKAQS